MSLSSYMHCFKNAFKSTFKGTITCSPWSPPSTPLDHNHSCTPILLSLLLLPRPSFPQPVPFPCTLLHTPLSVRERGFESQSLDGGRPGFRLSLRPEAAPAPGPPALAPCSAPSRLPAVLHPVSRSVFPVHQQLHLPPPVGQAPEVRR